MSDREQNEASSGHEEELVKIRQAIAAQEALRGILSDEEIEQSLVLQRDFTRVD
jgi:hypothetical protein